MNWATTFADMIQDQGWAVTPPLFNPAELVRIIARLEVESLCRVRGGLRNILDDDPIANIARSPVVRTAAKAVLGEDCFAVRGLLFDKTPESNWSVPWHQDLVIAVREKADVSGYGPWSEKLGVPHVQPPKDVLSNMVSLRIHVDDCPPENGPLRFLKSNHLGSSAPRIESSDIVSVPAQAGTILGFRPLLFHSSLPAEHPKRRRVIHLEFAGCELPTELTWRWRI